MDDHMLDRLFNEIHLCFDCAKYESKDKGLDIKTTDQWRAAKVLISAYNSLVKLYYLPEYQKGFLRTIKSEYESYLYFK